MKEEKRIVRSLQGISLQKQKLRFFLLFLGLSFVFWFFTKFSKEYTALVPFSLVFEAIPPGVILNNDTVDIEATITASGFQFLYYYYWDNRLEVDLSSLAFEGGVAQLSLNAQFQSIQSQLLGSTQIINLYPADIDIRYTSQTKKRVPVRIPYRFSMAVGYGISRLDIVPDSVDLLGSLEQLRKFNHVEVVPLAEKEIASSLRQNLNLKPLPEPGVEMIPSTVEIALAVDQFSERSYKLPIEISQLPDSLAVKLFPGEVVLTFSARLSRLKEIKEEDFILAVSYDEIAQNQPASVYLKQSPSGIKNIRIDPKTVEYLVRK